MVQESLLNYIKTQISSGQNLDSITSILLKQGFSQQQLNEAYVQLGYFKSNQVTTPLGNTKKNFSPIIVAVLALFVLLILGTFALTNKKIKNTLTQLPTTSQITQATQTLPNCSDPSHWSTPVETSFNATTYLKPVSVTTCEYTDPLLGYNVQYPAHWYVIFTSSHPAEKSNTLATISAITDNNGTTQVYNAISFDSQQPTTSNNSPQAVSIYISSIKTNYSDIISYMKSIQESPGISYQSLIEKNVYHPISIAGQKAVQMQYTLGDSVGIDTKFISNSILYDVTFSSNNLNAINTNKQYYTNLLNSFRLKPTQ
jgi:hypothetical protein